MSAARLVRSPVDTVSVVHRAESFRTALANDKLGRILAAFERVVEDSYTSHPMRGRSALEDRRRCNIVIEAFRTMQGEYNWPTDQCLANLRGALGAELSGRRWTLPKRRTLWAPDPVLQLDNFGPAPH